MKKMSVIVITKDNFTQEVLEANVPVLVDFYAEWCGPCQMMKPVLHELAEENPQIKVCKVDVDENMELAVQFGVQSIPFFAAFKQGKLVQKTIGVQSKEELLALLA